MVFDSIKLRLKALLNFPSALRLFIGGLSFNTKAVLAAAAGATLVFAAVFFIYPSIRDYFAEKDYRNEIEELRKSRENHETNANVLDNRRIEQEKELENFQANRNAAQNRADRAGEDLDQQKGVYENAKNGNVNIDSNLSLRERRRRVLARDKELYPK